MKIVIELSQEEYQKLLDGRIAVTTMRKAILNGAPLNLQESYDFAKWVATEIFDEWEYNKDSFAEIACRKLSKVGIVRAKGDEWELVEPQESEDKECQTSDQN